MEEKYIMRNERSISQILEIIKENHEEDLVTNNIFMLWNNIIPEDLPSDISVLQSIDSKHIELLLMRIKRNDFDSLFEMDPSSGLIKNILLKDAQTPPYIFNVGAEGIDYLVYKHNNKFRKITIPNVILFIAFIYNTIEVYNDLYKEIYFNLPIEDNLISYSTSPIIDPVGQFETIESFYGTFDLEYMKGVIHSEKTKSILFDYFKLEKLKKEGMNRYILKTDIENFFNNIYTHQLSKLKNMEPFSRLDSQTISVYFDFLDTYNMKVNQNQTKGIITGPISSSISSELLMISFDKSLDNYLKEREIQYSRFVDDMFFYSGSKAKLEELNLFIQTKLHEIGLETKFEKTIILNGFDYDDNSNIDKIHHDFPMLHHEYEETHELNHQLFMHFREYIIELISSDSISTVKAMITKINHKVDSKQIIVTNDLDIVDPLVSFILKLSIVHPELIKHLMKLLDTIIMRMDRKILGDIIRKLVDKSLKISQTMPDNTLLEVWLHSITNRYLSKDYLMTNWEKLVSIYNKKEINPLLLLTYIRKDKCDINDKIEEYVLEQYTKNANGKNVYSSISYSKWWIVIFELHCMSHDYFTQLFVSRSNDSQIDKLGILNDLIPRKLN